MDRKWWVMLVLVLVGATLALTTRWWLPQVGPALGLVEQNSELIQSLQSLIEIVGVLFAGVLFYFRLWLPRNDRSRDFILVGDDSVLMDSAEMWHRLGERKPSSDLRETTKQYLTFYDNRYRFLSLKGMGPTDKVDLKLPLLDLYVPLRARLRLPEGETSRTRAVERKRCAKEVGPSARMSWRQPVTG